MTSPLLSGTRPATVFRLVAAEALKLTADALVAVPVDEDMPLTWEAAGD